MVNLFIITATFLLTSILAIPFQGSDMMPQSGELYQTPSTTMASVETKLAKASASHSSEASMEELEDKITLIIAAAKRSLELNPIRKAGGNRGVKSNSKSKRRVSAHIITSHSWLTHPP